VQSWTVLTTLILNGHAVSHIAERGGFSLLSAVTTDQVLDEADYPLLSAYTAPVKAAEREIVGRTQEMMRIQAGLSRPELSNLLLLAPAGSGKTALVQGTMVQDSGRLYLEVNVAKLGSNLTHQNDMAARLKELFDEASAFYMKTGRDLVLFIDEFHRIVQSSEVATEALLPLLADSGTRGIRIIAATTLERFDKVVSSNQALVERLYRINVPETDKATTVEILWGYARRYKVDHLFYGNQLFELIYEYTNRYVPANSQPRKSVFVLDAMLGWYTKFGRRLDSQLLADVLYESEGIRVNIKVDAASIKEQLSKRVLSQEAAIAAIESRLQTAVADLNNQTRPVSTFLFSGATGVGKTELAKALAELLFDSERYLLQFDMTEYSQPSSLDRFREELTSRVWMYPYSIILLDEIEKACGAVTKLLLRVLYEGRLTNRNNREVSFLNSYIILTTNAASEVYAQMEAYVVDDNGSGQYMEEYERLIRRSLKDAGDAKFPPELINRFDAFVPFQPLSEQTLLKIARKNLRDLQKRVSEIHGVELLIADNEKNSVPEFLIKENIDTSTDAGGARGVIRRIDSKVTAVVSRFINMNPDIRRIGIRVEGTTVYQDVNKRISDAYIKAFPVQAKS